MFSLHAALFISLHFLILFGNSRQDDGNATQKHWALLVAGSKGYLNYRHQADVCHAYHVVRNHGIPPEQIVVMMYDDIASSPENPVKGNLINEPDGPNVYKGVGKDYTGDEVSPDVFLKVLSGDSEGVEILIGRKGKVIKSGPNDRVFVYFADHGAPGLIAFPDEELLADDLNEALTEMYQNKQYKQLVLYVEACESGSMFNKILRDDINIYATTAANPGESSYACYYDERRQTYLGDVYSVNWMQDSDVDNLKKETLHKQFRLVKKETNTSHVMQYGDMAMAKLSVGDFQGNMTDNNLYFRQGKTYHNPNVGAVPSEDVALEILKRKNDQEALKKLIYRRDATKRFFEEVVISVSSFNYWTLYQKPVMFSNFKCYKNSIAQIKKSCPGMNLVQNDYALRSLRAIANLCEAGINIENILMKIRELAEITPLCVAK